MFVERRARLRGLVSNARSARLSGVIALAVVLGGCQLAIDGEAPPRGQDAIRLVRAAPGHETRALALSTAALYAKNDPWRAYLAGESICPGGERVGLPAARQVTTLACLVNYARKRRGLAPLTLHPSLSGASAAKAKAIIRCQAFTHDPCGEEWTFNVRSTGYRGAIGENLYIASGRWGAPRVAVDAWLNSPGHRENLFSSEWREQGMALVTKQRFGDYRNVSLWVNVFGDR